MNDLTDWFVSLSMDARLYELLFLLLMLSSVAATYTFCHWSIERQLKHRYDLGRHDEQVAQYERWQQHRAEALAARFDRRPVTRCQPTRPIAVGGQDDTARLKQPRPRALAAGHRAPRGVKS